ncbi:unnamed protein product [Sphagnum balticum]
MPKFESPLGKQSIPERPMKHLEIPDESGFQPPPNQQPMGGGYGPSVSRRVGRPMTDEEMADFQARMQENQDPDSDLAEAEREFKKLRQEKLRGIERLSDGARKRTEMLTDMTRSVRTADIDGQVYKLQSLKGKEMREAIAAASRIRWDCSFPL